MTPRGVNPPWRHTCQQAPSASYARIASLDGVLEILRSHRGSAYRAVYTVRFEKAVYVLVWSRLASTLVPSWLGGVMRRQLLTLIVRGISVDVARDLRTR